MEGLDVSKIPMDLILNILNIIILFIIVRALVYKPVKRFMDKRSSSITDAQKNADDRLSEAEALRTEYEGLIAKSADEGQKLISESEARASAESSEIIKKAKESAAAILDEARDKAENERRATLSNMQNEVCDLALKIAGRVIERNVSDDDNKRLADSFFDVVSGEAGKDTLS